MLPIFQKKFVQELRDFSAVSGEGCRSERRGEFHLNNSTFRVTLDTSTDASCRDVSHPGIPIQKRQVPNYAVTPGSAAQNNRSKMTM
jgi:hypothetical protein